MLTVRPIDFFFFSFFFLHAAQRSGRRDAGEETGSLRFARVASCDGVSTCHTRKTNTNGGSAENKLQPEQKKGNKRLEINLKGAVLCKAVLSCNSFIKHIPGVSL